MNYDNIISKVALEMKPSGIRKFFDLLDDMEGVISLGVGQPDFMTPWHIRKAGIESLQDGKTFYTSNAGLLEMRCQLSEYLKRRFNLTYEPKGEIVVTVGGSEAIDITMRALVNPGDEVLIPEPSFVCYNPIAKMCGGVPVTLPTYEKDEFKLTPEVLESAITSKSKLLVLPFPNNPTGAIMTKEDLEKIAEVVLKHNLMVLSDEIYAELTYGGKHVSIASIPGMWERTVLVNGFSKAYAMTGWRLGFACGPKPIISQMTKIHQYAIMCAPTTAQYAAIQALKEGDADIEYMANEYDKRRKLVLSELRRIGIHCFEPRGAFYFFPSIKKFGMSSEEFCERLLREEKVAAVPGNAFGDYGEGHIRISYAYSTKNLLEAMKRIEKFIKKIQA